MGETRVTDAGLVHLSGFHRLKYLGLRGDAITDAGLARLVGLTSLTGLHLGQTDITDGGLRQLLPLIHLETLWLHDKRASAIRRSPRSPG